MTSATRVPAALIAAPGSGHGKSVLTAGLARLHRNRGRRVRVFKVGPDFLDPMVLSLAAGTPAYQLDLWMLGEDECRRRLAAAAREADVIFVEAAMGLFDGEPSPADLAACFGLAVWPVIDATGMAQSFAAVASGLARFDPRLSITGVIANRVGSDRHAALLAARLPHDLLLRGQVPRHQALALPERHLGLVQAAEQTALSERLDAVAAVLSEAGLDVLPPACPFVPSALARCPALLAERRVAIARDGAFSFIYPANLDQLRELGAELQFFSPLADEAVPTADAVWLPGGYPELHAHRLAACTRTRDSLRAHHAAGRPILAECGGLIACAEALVDLDGERHAMFGLLPGTVSMHGRFQGLGMHAWEAAPGLAPLRGHAFHHSSFDTPLTPTQATIPRSPRRAESIYRRGSLLATYFHAYFPSAPTACAALFGAPALRRLELVR